MKLRHLSQLLWLCVGLRVSGQTSSPTHEGKNVEHWFQAYVAGAGTRVSPNAYSARNGEFLLLPTMKTEAEPVWPAFQTLGEKAVPFLIQRLQVNPSETEQTRLERREAVELLHRLGECACPAGSALLALLPAATDEQCNEICAAAHAVHTDPKLIDQFLLGPDNRRPDSELVQFARRLGWSGAEVARRLGAILDSKDRELAREALGLLEAAGVGAIPTVDQIAAALRSSDQEMRYLAARCLAGPLATTPVANQALQSVLDDSNLMVRKVARRTLPPPAATSSTTR